MVEKYIPSQNQIDIFQKGKEVGLEIEGRTIFFFKGDKEGQTYIKTDNLGSPPLLSEIATISNYFWNYLPYPPLAIGSEVVEREGKKIIVLQHEVRSRLKTFFDS